MFFFFFELGVFLKKIEIWPYLSEKLIHEVKIDQDHISKSNVHLLIDVIGNSLSTRAWKT